jgi:hypothetical protein
MNREWEDQTQTDPMRHGKRSSNRIQTNSAASDPDSVRIVCMQFFQMRFNLRDGQVSMPSKGDFYCRIHNKSPGLPLFKSLPSPDCCLLAEAMLHKKKRLT